MSQVESDQLNKHPINLYQVFQNSLHSSQNTTGITELTENEVKHYTYQELCTKIEQISARIVEIGLKKGTRVGVFIENGIERVSIVFALVKCGIVFVPLDPVYDKGMIEHIVQQTQLNDIIIGENMHTKELWSQYNININTLHITSFCETVSGCSYSSVSGNSDNICAYEDPACILFTSGSTGSPKGVVLSQGNFLAMVAWYTGRYQLNSTTDVLCLYSHCTFVTYWMEMFLALSNCMPCITVKEEAVKNFPLFSRFLQEYRVSVLIGVPTLLVELIRCTENNTTLKQIGIGGECAPSNILNTFSQHFPNAVVYNEYGLTETTGIAIATVNDMSTYESSLCIGSPLDCIRAYIVSDAGDLVEDGCEGELWLSGATIATGYVKEDLNIQYFVKNPFEHDATFSKVFKTGDYVKMNKGVIDYIGRRDNIVKIKGQKVNINEIEKSIKEVYPNIELYVTAKINIKRGQWMLCAFYKSTEEISITDLRGAMSKVFPNQLISKLIKVDNFPTTFSGKINRKELSKYPIDNYEDYNHLNYLSESDNKIDKLKYAACKILDLTENEFDPSKNFFQHGGDSITIFSFLEEVKNLGFNFIYTDLVKRFNELCEKTNCNDMAEENVSQGSDNIQRVIFTDLSESEVDFIGQRMMEAFITRESMFLFHASKGFNFTMFFNEIVKACWKLYPHLCMAMKLQGKIVGAFITCPTGDVPGIDYLPIEFQDLCHLCEDDLLHRLIGGGHNIADALLLYVDSELPNELSLKVFTALSGAQVKLVKQNNFTVLVSFNLSPATKGISKSIYKSTVENVIYPFQFKINEDFPYKEFDPNYYIEIAADYLDGKAN